MKVQLIVVQGKPEGKMIPLVGSIFRIGRGETCNLRPNSEQVSREHAEFAIVGDTVTVRDLGSRNGTLVNGKAVTETWTLKDRDLVQVGPLTFAVSIEAAPVAAAAKAPSKPARAPAAGKAASPDDVSHDDIEAWLVSDAKSPAPESPSGVYGGDTITIAAFKNAAPKPAAPAPAAAPAPTTAADDDDDDGIADFDRLPEGAGDDDPEEEPDAEAPTEAIPEEFVDESNPFYKKKKGPEAAAPAKPGFKDTSDAASEILRKMMERRRGSK